MLNFLRSMSLPACVDTQVNKVSRYYMINTESPDGSLLPRSLNAFYGPFQKQSVVACATEAVSAMGDGNVGEEAGMTMLTMEAGGSPAYILWGQSGGDRVALVDTDKELTQHFLSSDKTLDPEGRLVKYIGQTNRSVDIWMASIVDYTSGILAVPSLGYSLSADMLNDMKSDSFGVKVQVLVYFDTDEIALEAQAALLVFIEKMTDDQGVAKLLQGDIDIPTESARAVLEKALDISLDGSQLSLRLSADKDQLAVLMNKMVHVGQRFMDAQPNAPVR